MNELNACFKWLVPAGNIVGVIFRYYPGRVECEITVEEMADFTNYESFVDASSYEETVKKPALAFCKAVELLLDAEMKKA